MTRSGSCSSTAGATPWPESTSMISVPGSPTTATTSARTEGASLATTIVRTGVRLTGAGRVGKDVVGDEPEPMRRRARRRRGAAPTPPGTAPPGSRARRRRPPRVGSPPGSPAGCRRARRGRCPVGRSGSGSPVSKAGWTRLTTRPSTARPDSLSLSANHPASSTVSERGEVTSTKAVVRRASRRAHVLGPGPESLLHALEGLEERHGVVDDLRPRHLGDRAEQRLGGNRHGAQIGPRRHQQQLEQAVAEEPGEPARARRGSRGRCARAGCRRRPGRSAPFSESS